MGADLSDPGFWLVLGLGSVVIGLILVAILILIFKNESRKYQAIGNNILKQNQSIHDELKQFNQDMKVIENTFQKFINSFETLSEKFSELNESLGYHVEKEEEVIKELSRELLEADITVHHSRVWWTKSIFAGEMLRGKKTPDFRSCRTFLAGKEGGDP